MIIAGIDEAGLGPAMGPLCVTCAILRLPDNSLPSDPWQIHEEFISSKKKRGCTRALVADSKVAHKAGGMAGLEKVALAFLDACGKDYVSREAILDNCGSADTVGAISGCAWYKDAFWQLPGFSCKEEISGLSKAISSSDAVIVDMRARVLSAGMLNRLFDDGLNKSEALLLQTGMHLHYIYEHFRDEEVLVVVDKQGGRNFYAPFLMDVLGGAWVTTLCEGAKLSEYEVGKMRVCFMPKADRDAYPVALASIFAKYLRERFMGDLNSWFASKVSGLKPTAGYHGDAPRFMEDISGVLLDNSFDKKLLWRDR